LPHAQIAGLTPEQAEQILPGASKLPPASMVRRSVIFEPRQDIQRVIFICTPHRGSQLATSGIAGLGIRLIRLPSWIAEELADFADISFGGRRLPTSIHGLSPDSRFLQALHRASVVSPAQGDSGD
jgi:hypothetical protein